MQVSPYKLNIYDTWNFIYPVQGIGVKYNHIIIFSKYVTQSFSVWSFMICTSHQIMYRRPKQEKLHRTRGTYGERRGAYRIVVGKPEK
jgi:hypothetical protein